MSRIKDSVVWDYFTIVNDTSAKCGLCSNVMKHPKSSTSNLKRHLKSRHPTVNLEARRFPNIREEEEIVDNPDARLPQQPPSQLQLLQQPSQQQQQQPSQQPRPSGVQQSVRQYFIKPLHANKRKAIDEQLVKMICKEYQPFRIVEETEFVKFVHMLNPGYALPSRKTVSTSLLPVLYEKVHAEVVESLKFAKYVGITTDGWTSITNESFYAITVHYIGKDGQLQAKLLSCERFPPVRHDAMNISEYLKKTFEDWGILNKIVAITTDNASVMIAAVQLLSIRHIKCFAHTLNLIVQNALDTISEVIMKK
uniref:Zinc finger BED domain-containing protein 1 n=1 Tax=Cacopsylla melanoneura TaxID=428564 RepID=A0A8D9FH44_9HEMI